MIDKELNTAADVADEAKAVGHDAAIAAAGYAREAKAIATDSSLPIGARVQEAKALAGEAADTARGLGGDLGELAGGAKDVAGAYTRYAADVVKAKLDVAKQGLVARQHACEDYVRENPVRAAVTALAIGAVLTQLLLSALFGRRSRSRHR